MDQTTIPRRIELLNAAREVFAEKGFEGTKISEIVARVGVAQGTFYLYFPSKVSLVYALAEMLQKKIEFPSLSDKYIKHTSRSLQISTNQASRHMHPYPPLTPLPVRLKKDRRENNHPPLTTSPIHLSLCRVVLPDEKSISPMAVILYLSTTISRPLHIHLP